MKKIVFKLLFIIIGGIFLSLKSPINSSRIVKRNYRAAINNSSTFQYFVVIKYFDPSKERLGEVCTQGNFLRGAIHEENRINYSILGNSIVKIIAHSNHDRVFNFKSENAKANIGIDDYELEELDSLRNEIDFSTLSRKIANSGKWEKHFVNYREMRMYAHALFNEGILTGENNCAGGTLYYVNLNE